MIRAGEIFHHSRHSTGRVNFIPHLKVISYTNTGTMLGSTFIMTIFIEIIMLKFVFMGVHFYVGIVCCLYILYLLFTLGYSDPGVAFAHLEKIKAHEELNLCD